MGGGARGGGEMAGEVVMSIERASQEHAWEATSHTRFDLPGWRLKECVLDVKRVKTSKKEKRVNNKRERNGSPQGREAPVGTRTSRKEVREVAHGRNSVNRGKRWKNGGEKRRSQGKEVNGWE